MYVYYDLICMYVYYVLICMHIMFIYDVLCIACFYIYAHNVHNIHVYFVLICMYTMLCYKYNHLLLHINIIYFVYNTIYVEY